MEWLWFILSGFFAGIISGMGIGGGAILIPALGIFCGIGQREAQHINLLYFLPTALTALFAHNGKGNIEKKGLAKLIAFGLIGAVAGALIAVNIDADWLRKGFGVFLLVTAIIEFTKGMKR
jgi:uncharacterized membrane protein YfcA